MKRMLVLLTMAIALLFAGGIEADAAPYEVAFSDNINHWVGWGNGFQDSQDVIGNPNISGGNAIISQSGHLTGVNFSYTSTGNGTIPAGDLFIDVGADNYWDYVLTTTGVGYDSGSRSFEYTFDDKYMGLVYYFENGFSALEGVNNEYYLTTPNNEGLRYSHPIALSDTGAGLGELLQGQRVWFENGFWYKDAEDQEALDFEAFSLDLLGQDFIIGFMPDCANDVIYAKVNSPVPIPTSVLLFGSGLIGLVGIRRRAVKAAV